MTLCRFNKLLSSRTVLFSTTERKEKKERCKQAKCYTHVSKLQDARTLDARKRASIHIANNSHASCIKRHFMRESNIIAMTADGKKWLWVQTFCRGAPWWVDFENTVFRFFSNFEIFGAFFKFLGSFYKNEEIQLSFTSFDASWAPDPEYVIRFWKILFWRDSATENRFSHQFSHFVTIFEYDPMRKRDFLFFHENPHEKLHLTVF